MTDLLQDAVPIPDGSTAFAVWAPLAQQVEVELARPDERHTLASSAGGYHCGRLRDVGPGRRYALRVDGGAALPDPRSRSQPDGVHGRSEVIDLAFEWTDRGWRGIELERVVTYELHVGTFTPAGTFDAVIPQLARLEDLGITAIELMPVASFPGTRNWGYDGVLPFAVQASYGGPAGLQRLVDACHAHQLAVVLDVVYNHLGPEGNHLEDFGPYFTAAYATPWGKALNFDGPYSDGVRRYFIDNALQWVTDFHIDGLRLDAVHAILDRSALPFLEVVAAAVHARGDLLGRRKLVIAESDRNDPRLVKPAAAGGTGMDAAWCDDLHHALHALLTGESAGYYADFGSLDLLAAAWSDGIAYTGQHSQFRHRRHGRPPAGAAPQQFVVCAQNHDQIGNRMRGERLAALVSPAAVRLAAAVVLLAPCSPLLFMGEEWGEQRPFLYFTSHTDPELARAVREGRKAEFADFAAQGEPPDPQDPATFENSVLHGPDPASEPMHDYYRALLALRTTLPVGGAATVLGPGLLVARRGPDAETALILLHFAPGSRTLPLPAAAGRWQIALDSCASSADSARPDSVLRAGDELNLQGYQALVLLRTER